ncbi:MAG: hypothetical protein KA956_00210 [Pyrinomonadaceae bacterium]|nr:hypothetical protein [Acidobacteriota bacterium]MBK7933279.1 hypothetical protein [Acidobacteriota bacterium]MBP7374873.1 hypothetical protein [Pyrinomonadaceae bacterium]
MKSGICPKCESDEVYKGDSRSPIGIQTSALHVQSAVTYICVACGYYEFSAFPGPDLDRVKNRFDKVAK